MQIVHTKDIDASFFPRLRTVAAFLGADPLHMMKVMKSESDVRADAWNDNPKNLPPEKRYNASGLIQFMPPTLTGLGWKTGHAAFRRLNPTEQLDFVQAYYSSYRGHLGTVGGLYVATFLPGSIAYAGNRDFVLTAKGGRLGWAYEPNSAFDANKDLQITVGELEDAVTRNCRGPRWAELLARLEGHAAIDPELVAFGFDLGTVAGIQRALERLGFSPGTVDGLPGPRTRAAVAAFQAAAGDLVVDGIVGPMTRQALEIELKTRA